MNADEVIEIYIDDTVRLLPRRQRDDVAAELRALLNEELNARARESGQLPRSSDLASSLGSVAMASRTRLRLAISRPGASSIPPTPGAS